MNTEDLIVELIIQNIEQTGGESVVFNQHDGLGLIMDGTALNHPGRKHEFDIVKECGIRAVKGDDYGWLITDTAMIVKVMTTMALSHVKTQIAAEQGYALQPVRPEERKADVLSLPKPDRPLVQVPRLVDARSLACGEDIERPAIVDAHGGAIGCEGINPEVATIEVD